MNKDSGEGYDGSKENSYGEVENMSEETEAQSATNTDQSLAKSDTSCSMESTAETSHGNGSSCSESSRESIRSSPDECSIKIYKNNITIQHKPTRLRSETRGQYMCCLALEFTRNKHKKVTPQPKQNSDSDEMIMYAYFTFLQIIASNFMSSRDRSRL